MSILDRITTKDILAVLVVGSVLIFNGISMWFDKPLDAGTMGMAGLIVGYYFNGKGDTTIAVHPEPLEEPLPGEPDGPVG